MKKFRWFTLLETVLVVVIIWIVSVSLLAFRQNIQDKQDISREALTVFYKEMNSSIKDFQRNRIREDENWVAHEVSYLYINFNNTGKHDLIVWDDLVIWSIFLYTWDNGRLMWHFDWTPLILENEYSAFQALKWSDKYTFYTRNKDQWEVTSILITNQWRIFKGYLDKVITDATIRLNEEEDNSEESNPRGMTQKQIIKELLKPKADNPLQRLTFDFEFNNDLKRAFEKIEQIYDHTYKFLVCWWYWISNPQPICIISINAITKTTTLDRCANEKYAWIKCEEFAECR